MLLILMFYKVSFGNINRLVHKHFSDSCLAWCLSWCLLVFISSFLLAYCVFFLYLLFCTCFLVCSASVANKRTHYIFDVCLRQSGVGLHAVLSLGRRAEEGYLPTWTSTCWSRAAQSTSAASRTTAAQHAGQPRRWKLRSPGDVGKQ